MLSQTYTIHILIFPRSFFHHSVSIVDSFHVIKWINDKINSYITLVKRRYQERDRKELEKKNIRTNRNYQTRKDSREVYILKNFKWVLLEDQKNINYDSRRTYCSYLCAYLDTYQREDLFFGLDSNFKKIREEKELYIDFNDRYVGEPDKALEALDRLIDHYRHSPLKMFQRYMEQEW